MAGIAQSTVCRIVIEVSVTEMLLEEHVEKLFPNTVEVFKTAMVDMELEWQSRFAFSAADGTHPPIKRPKGGNEVLKQYYNLKYFYSIVLLTLVDTRYHFTWVSVGAPGNTNDSTYFQSTDLWNRIEAGLVIPDQVQVLNNLEIPPLILGDGGFPLRT